MAIADLTELSVDHFRTKPDDIPDRVWLQAEVGVAPHEKRQELIARAIMAEREACAQICETLGVLGGSDPYADWKAHANNLATTIRSRSQTNP